MQLERLTAGEYAVTDGEKLISLKKGLNRKWTVEPIVGVTATPRTVRSYGDAKLVAQAMLNGEATVTAATPKAPRRTARTAKPEPVETITDREALATKLREVADALTRH